MDDHSDSYMEYHSDRMDDDSGSDPATESSNEMTETFDEMGDNRDRTADEGIGQTLPSYLVLGAGTSKTNQSGDFIHSSMGNPGQPTHNHNYWLNNLKLDFTTSNLRIRPSLRLSKHFNHPDNLKSYDHSFNDSRLTYDEVMKYLREKLSNTEYTSIAKGTAGHMGGYNIHAPWYQNNHVENTTTNNTASVVDNMDMMGQQQNNNDNVSRLKQISNIRNKIMIELRKDASDYPALKRYCQQLSKQSFIEYDYSGYTILIHAIMIKADIRAVSIILKCNDESMKYPIKGTTMLPVHIAVSAGHEELVKFLLKEDVHDTYLNSSNNKLPIHTAILDRRDEMAKTILLHDRKRNIENQYNHRHRLTHSEYESLLERNNDHFTMSNSAGAIGNNFMNNNTTAATTSANNTMNNGLIVNINTIPSIISSSYMGKQCFHIACMRSSKLVEWMLVHFNRSYTIGAVDELGNRDVHYAAISGDINTMKVILNYYPTTTDKLTVLLAKNTSGCTAVYVSCSSGHYQMTEYILSLFPKSKEILDEIYQIEQNSVKYGSYYYNNDSYYNQSYVLRKDDGKSIPIRKIRSDKGYIPNVSVVNSHITSYPENINPIDVTAAKDTYPFHIACQQRHYRICELICKLNYRSCELRRTDGLLGLNLAVKDFQSPLDEDLIRMLLNYYPQSIHNRDTSGMTPIQVVKSTSYPKEHMMKKGNHSSKSYPFARENILRLMISTAIKINRPDNNTNSYVPTPAVNNNNSYIGNVSGWNMTQQPNNQSNNLAPTVDKDTMKTFQDINWNMRKYALMLGCGDRIKKANAIRNASDITMKTSVDRNPKNLMEFLYSNTDIFKHFIGFL